MSFNLSAKEFDYLQKTVFGEPKRAARAAQQEDELNSTDLYLQQHRKPEEQGFIADFTDSVQMGAWQGLSDLSRGLGVVFNSDWLNQAADWAAHKAEANYQTMSSKMQQALGQSAFDGYDSEKGEGKGVLNAYWWAGNFGALLGQQLDTVATLGAGKIATTGLKMAGKQAGKMLSRETAEQIGKAATQQAARFGIPQKYHQSIGVTAVMSAMQAGGRANQVFEEIDQLSDEQLAQLDGFRQDYWDLKESEEGQGLDDRTLFDQAKARFKQRAGKDAALDPVALATDLTTNAISGLGGGFWGAMKPAQTLKDSFFKGGAIEALTEGMQGAAETYAVNDTARNFYDTDRTLTEGMGRNVVDGMVLGGVMGAGMGAMDTHGHRRTMNRERRRYIEAIQTGDEVVDQHLRSYVEMVNNAANDIDDLISQSRFNAMHTMAQKEARAKQVMAEVQAEAQAQAEQAVGSEGEIQQAQETANPTPFHQRNIDEVMAQFQQDGLDDNDVQTFIDSQLKQATNDLAELNANPFKMGTDYQQSLADKKAYQAKLADAQARFDYWTQAKKSQTESGVSPEQATVNGNEDTVVEDDLDPVQYEDLSEQPDFEHNQDRIWKGQKNGQPFRTEAEAENSDTFKKAEAFRLNPTVIEKDGSFLVEVDKFDDNIKFSRSAQETPSFYETEQRLGGKEAYESAVRNGETELDYRQWVQVRTPEFKAWFGDWENDPENASKVVNPRTGEPLVVYHGTNAEFYAFDKTKQKNEHNQYGEGFYFTGKKATADLFGDNQMPVFLDAKISQKDKILARRKGIQLEYDHMRPDDSRDIWVMREPNQIKSATSNTGAFDVGNDDIRYSLNEDPHSAFAKAVDSVANGGSVAGYVNVGSTPDVLKMLGLPDVKVTIHGNTFSKVMQDKHNITAQTLKQLPTQINNPVAIMKSSTQENGYIVLTELVERENGKDKPVIAALHLKQDANGLELINIASVYGRSNAQIQRGLENDLLYWNNKKGADFINAFGLQLPSYALKNQPYAFNIKTETDLSQYQSENQFSDNNTSLQQNANLEQTHAQIKQIVGGKLAEHFNVVSREQLGITDPTIEAGYDPKTGKIFIVEDNIRDNGILSRDERLKWVAWHELAHRGVQVKFAHQYRNLMSKIEQNTTVRELADAIQQQREETRDNRLLAVEEALAELNAAYSTGKMEELKARYGIKVPPLREKSLRAWFEMTAERIRDFVARLFGKETAEKFSQEDLIKLIKDIQSGMGGDIGRFDGEVKNSLNEEPNAEFANAVPKRQANSFDQVKEVAKDFINKPLLNEKTGIKAVISGANLSKMLSGKAHNKSTSLHDHLLAVANADQLFQKSIYGWTENDKNHSADVVGVHKMFAPLNIDDNVKLVKLTVKELKPEQGNRVYSVETIEIGNENAIVPEMMELGFDANSHRLHDGDVQSLIQRIQKFNSGEAIKFSRTQTNTEQLRRINRNTPLENLSDVVSDIVNTPVGEWKQRLSDYGKVLNANIFDALAPLKYAEDKAGIRDHSQSAYTAARLAAGSASITQASLAHGLPEYRDGIIQRKQGTSSKDALVGIMEELGSDSNDFFAWMAGNRAERLMQEGREKWLSASEIAELKALNKGKEAKFEQARIKFMAWNKSLLDLAESAGLINAQDRANWESHDFYIPFYREDDNGDAIAPYRNKGLGGQDAGIRRLRGSDRAVNDLLENVVHNASKLIDASVKNIAMAKAVTNLTATNVIEVIQNPTPADWRKVGANRTKADKDGGYLAVRLNGVETVVKVNDKLLFNAITNIDQPPLDYAGRKIFSGAKRVLTATVTSMPNFIVRNFFRDAAQAWTTDRNNGFKLGIDSLQGLKKAYQQSDTAIDLMFAGASFNNGFVDGGDTAKTANKIRKHLRKQGKSADEIEGFMKGVIFSKDKLDAVLDGYFKVAQASENANRIAVYERAIASGKSKAQAALESKDLMDFAMHGNAKAVRFLSDVLPFFNARLQGLSQLGRSMRDNPKGVASRGAMIALASVALAAMNEGEEWYEEQSDEIKDNFWLAKIGDEIIKIPKPFEVGVMFGTIPERLYRTMSGSDDTGLFKDRLLSALTNTLSLNPIPQAVKPIFEVYNNYDSFRGREIENMSDRRLIKQERYDNNTSLVARELGNVSAMFGLSPKQVDHLVNGYFGTLGMYVLGITDMGIRSSGDYGELPAKNWQEYPVLNAVFGGSIDVPRKYTKQMSDFYRYLNQASEIAATVKSYQDDGLIEKSRSLFAENHRLLAYRPQLNAVQKEVKQIRAQMELIQNNRNLDAEQKRERIDRLLTRRNALVTRIVEQMKDEDF